MFFVASWDEFGMPKITWQRGTGTSVRCEEKWNISATDERKWNPIFAPEAFLESKGM